jgi:hypothetical protein
MRAMGEGSPDFGGSFPSRCHSPGGNQRQPLKNGRTFWDGARESQAPKTRTIVLICGAGLDPGSDPSIVSRETIRASDARKGRRPRSPSPIVYRETIAPADSGGPAADFRPNPREPEAESVDDPLPELFHVKQFGIRPASVECDDPCHLPRCLS